MKRAACLGLLLLGLSASAQPSPTGQTGLVGQGFSNGAAIWLHPTLLGQSLVLTANQGAGLQTYDMAGNLVEVLAGLVVNVDVRFNVNLGGVPTDVVAVANPGITGVSLYSVSANTRQLSSLGAVLTTQVPSGVALYVDANGALSVFVVTSSAGVLQYTLSLAGSSLAGTLARTLTVGNGAEGAVADDLNHVVYVATDTFGISSYPADATASTTGTLVDTVGGTGHLTSPVKGLALYQASAGGGYLLASNSGASAYNVYRRGTNAYVTQFSLVAGDGGLDAPVNAIGIAVANRGLGSAYPTGLFVVQDTAAFNYKYVPWGAIASSTGLAVDTAFDPRGATPGFDGGVDAGQKGDGGGGNICPPPCSGTPPPGNGGLNACGCSGIDGTAAALAGWALALICRRKTR